MSSSARTAVTVAAAVAAIAGLAAETQTSAGGLGTWLPDLLTGCTLIAAGLVAVRRREAATSGLLIIAAGSSWFLGNLHGSSWTAAAWIGAHGLFLFRGFVGHALGTFWSGRPRGILAATAVVVNYAAAVLPFAYTHPWIPVLAAGLVVVSALVATRRASGSQRHARRASVLAAVVWCAGLAAGARTAGSQSGAMRALSEHGLEASLVIVVAVLAAAVARPGAAGYQVTDLVIELSSGSRGTTVRDALASALGDPRLVVAYARDGGYVDTAGRPTTLPSPESGRALTSLVVDRDSSAVIVHAEAVLDDAGVAAAVTTAVQLAATNARRQAEVREQVAELERSRRRLVAAADEQRIDLERRLQAGAGQALDRVGVVLRDSQPDGDIEASVVRVMGQLDEVRCELRDFGLGLHPRMLAERGLAAALRELTVRLPVPVEVTVATAELDPSVEITVWYLCSEALANVIKYADATRVVVEISPSASRVEVVVQDNGRGGASLTAGTGLLGLRDRVEALGGTLTLDSPRGRGTRLVAVMPLRQPGAA